MRSFDVAMSLGPTCRTKRQLKRVFGSNNCVRGVFDGQITPFPALCSYLENDFRGFFEPADVVLEHSIMRVKNTRFGTFHPHLTSHLLPVNLELARQKHEKLCASARAAMAGRRRVLFVRESSPDMPSAGELEAVIASRFPSLRFGIAVVEDATPYGEHWAGDDSAWNNGLAAYRISKAATLRNAGRRLAGHVSRYAAL